MLAKLKYGFLCDGAMLAAGKWTYQGVFERIHSFAFPVIHPEAVLAFKFNGSVGPHTLRVDFVDSKGAVLAPVFRQPIECREFADNVVTINLRGLALPTPGFYAFNLYLDEEREPFGVIDLEAARAERR
jgi:hypothetical protein